MKVDRSPERIPVIVAQLKALWLASPEQRLGQLLVNAMRTQVGEPTPDLFYVEDDQLIQYIGRLLQKG